MIYNSVRFPLETFNVDIETCLRESEGKDNISNICDNLKKIEYLAAIILFLFV